MMHRGMILIPTYRRPHGLAKALARLAAMETSCDITILVAENDPAGREGSEVARQAGGGRFPVRSIFVPERGVSHVRNALIATALADPAIEFVALLDDDEWPEPQWLEALLDMQHQTGADAVGGTVLPAFAAPPPAWAERMTLFRQEQGNGLVAMIWGTCNVLLTRACLENLSQPWFDPQFGLTGGEDVEFFARAKAQGAVFAWASAARLFEDIPQSRTSLRWIVRRSYRIGNTNARVQLRWRYRKLGHVMILAKSLGRLAATPLLALLNFARASRGVEALSLVARSIGEMGALLGIGYREYG